MKEIENHACIDTNILNEILPTPSKMEKYDRFIKSNDEAHCATGCIPGACAGACRA